jgi:hypothetical protein
MWQLFVNGLMQTGILAVDPKTFAAASGLAIADWEIMNYTGIGPSIGLGTPIPSKVFGWADPMPDISQRFYQPGSSLSNSYSTFLNSLSVASADLATIAQARSKALQFQMTDSTGNSWPGYGITPGLNDFLMASLQSVSSGKPPQIDFSVAAPPSADAGASAPSRLSAFGGAPPLDQADLDPPFFGFDRRPMVALQQAALAHLDHAMAGDVAPTVAPPATIRFQAQTAQMFLIQPFRWFSGMMVSTFYDKIDPASALANKSMFGPGGFLSGRSSQVLVAFKRVVTVCGQASLIAVMQAGVQQAKSDFNVGSFYFSADSAGTSVTQTGPGTIIFQDNTNAPSVIGVTVNAFGP